jgi:hypothetical protein
MSLLCEKSMNTLSRCRSESPGCGAYGDDALIPVPDVLVLVLAVALELLLVLELAAELFLSTNGIKKVLDGACAAVDVTLVCAAAAVALAPSAMTSKVTTDSMINFLPFTITSFGNDFRCVLLED